MKTEKNENKITVKENENYNIFNDILKEHKINYNIDKNFCEECSVIYSIDIKCLKHYKYNYKIELSPIEICKNMNENTIDNYKNNNFEKIDKCYLEKRKKLCSLIYITSLKMNFRSQTFFLSIYFLDVIFSNEESIKIIKNEKINYENLSLSCLLIASKYCENDPFIPILSSYKKAFEISSFYFQNVLKEEIVYYEILALKLLKYKLNYYTIYDFISFFFCHGIIVQEQFEDLNDDLKNKKILEKIYIKSRDYLDEIINKDLSLKFNSCFLAIFIFEKTIKEMIKKDFEKDYLSEIFERIYKINYKNENEYKEIEKILNKVDEKENKKDIKKEISALIFKQHEYYSPRNIINTYKENALLNSRNNHKSKNFISSIINRQQSSENKSEKKLISKSTFSSLTNSYKTDSQKTLTSSLYINNNNLFTSKLRTMNSYKPYNYNYNINSTFNNNNYYYGNLKGTNDNYLNKTHQIFNMTNNSHTFLKKNNPSTIIINNNININIGNIYSNNSKNYNHNYTSLTNKKYYNSNNYNIKGNYPLNFFKYDRKYN
jgi:hypothetical protein